MKSNFYLVFLFLVNVAFIYGQNTGKSSSGIGQYVGGFYHNDMNAISGREISKLLQHSVDNNYYNNKGIDGSVFLFEGWKNNGVISLGDKNYLFYEMNYDVYKDEFLAKISKDSIYVFDFNFIDKIILNGKTFKQHYDSRLNQTKIYEVVYENTDFVLLKDYYVVITEGSPNPMLNRAKDVVRKKSNYFTSIDNAIEPFKLKKSYIIDLIDDEKKEEFKKYVQRNNLSYSNESDVYRMLQHYLLK